MIKKVCKHCNNNFNVFNSEKERIFCSKKCYNSFFKRKFNCKYCGKEFIINRCDSRIFCSRECLNKFKKELWYKKRVCKICGEYFYPKSSKSIRNTCSKKCRNILNGLVRKGNRWKMTSESKDKISVGRKKYLSNITNLKKHAENTKNTWKNEKVRNSRLTKERNKKISTTQIKQYKSGERMVTPIFKMQNIYNNINFRSTWEVKFAKWCDKNKIKYEYESKNCRFAMDNGRTYIIDFYLPNINLFVEVKGYMKKYDIYKLNQVIKHNKKIVLIDKSNIDNICLNNFWKGVEI